MPLFGSVSILRIRNMPYNMTAISYISGIGDAGTRNAIQLLRLLIIGPLRSIVGVSAARQPVRFNVTADSLSRRFGDGIIMGTETRYLLVYIWDFVVPQIDLFASRINHPTSAYASWKQDMKAS